MRRKLGYLISGLTLGLAATGLCIFVYWLLGTLDAPLTGQQLQNTQTQQISCILFEYQIDGVAEQITKRPYSLGIALELEKAGVSFVGVERPTLFNIQKVEAVCTTSDAAERYKFFFQESLPARQKLP